MLRGSYFKLVKLGSWNCHLCQSSISHLGRLSSQPRSNMQLYWKNFFAFISTGVIKPKGSYIDAMNFNIFLLDKFWSIFSEQLELTFILKLKVSVWGCQTKPRVRSAGRHFTSSCFKVGERSSFGKDSRRILTLLTNEVSLNTPAAVISIRSFTKLRAES